MAADPNAKYRVLVKPLVTEKMIRATTLTGTKEEVLESVKAMKKAGIKQVAVQPDTDARTTIDTFALAVIRKMI